MFLLLSLAPTVLTVLGLLTVVTFLVSLHVAASTRPVESVPADGWALTLLDMLDEAHDLVDAAWDTLALVVEPRRGHRAPRRMARPGVQRARQNWAAFALHKRTAPTVEAPPATVRVPYLAPGTSPRPKGAQAWAYARSVPGQVGALPRTMPEQNINDIMHLHTLARFRKCPKPLRKNS